MLRVLHVFHNMGNGGVENFVMNYYRCIDREKIQFDFLTSVEGEGFFDEEIRQLGGKIYRAFPKRKNPLRNFLEIMKIVKENDYQIVHRHTGSSISNIDLLAAKCGGAKTIISHAHSTSAGKKWLHYLAKNLLRVRCEKYACSKLAGEWLHGKKAIENNEVQIIYNAVDTKKFEYNEQERKRIRCSNGVDEAFVIGHVGNFNTAKNHEFIIEVFREISKKKKNAYLWLIGEGVLKEKIIEKVKKYGLEKQVYFWGNRNDVGNIMQGMDAFLFPSVFEGYPVTLVEAQCSGLPCFVSEKVIPKEINLLGQMLFIKLDDSADIWAEKIIHYKQTMVREVAKLHVKNAGLDIQEAARDLEQRYLKYAGK